MSTVNPTTKVATFRILVRPFVAWIWLGCLFMILGTTICVSPSVREVLGERVRDRARRPLPAMATTSVFLLAFGAALLGASGVAQGQNEGTSSLHAGSVTMNNPEEKHLFDRMLCMCGDCQRLPLSSCSCGWADKMRAKIRDQVSAGMGQQQIQDDYRSEFGARSIAIPTDRGLDRALWAVPVVAIAAAAGLLVWRGRKWVSAQPIAAAAPAGLAPRPRDGYDAELDAELRKLDE